MEYKGDRLAYFVACATKRIGLLSLVAVGALFGEIVRDVKPGKDFVKMPMDCGFDL